MVNPDKVKVKDKLILDINDWFSLYYSTISHNTQHVSSSFKKRYKKSKWRSHTGKTVVVLAIKRDLVDPKWTDFVVRFETDPKSMNFATYCYYLKPTKKKKR